jgi:hypothetical protein
LEVCLNLNFRFEKISFPTQAEEAPPAHRQRLSLGSFESLLKFVRPVTPTLLSIYFRFHQGAVGVEKTGNGPTASTRTSGNLSSWRLEITWLSFKIRYEYNPDFNPTTVVRVRYSGPQVAKPSRFDAFELEERRGKLATQTVI